tara:strand:- start:212 stop:1147 length:936 start_codon:yes stop_codon:yes gene_type:complete
MPTVNGIKFDYTKEGVQKAKAWSEMTGKPMQMEKKYKGGGLASKGRFGDTKMRKVNGELSHVNPTEAKWIDNYGPLGQKLTQALGSGTINPKTGKKEYFLGQIIAFINHVFGNNPEAQDISDDVEETIEETIENTPEFLDDASNVIAAAGSGQQGINPDDMIIGSGGTTGGLNFGENNLDVWVNEAGEIIDDLGNIYDTYGNIITGGSQEEKERFLEEKKSPKFWGFEKFGKTKKGSLQNLVDEMLTDKPKKMAMGGPISMGSMTPGRRMYSMPQRKKRPVMQTSTAGMHMRGGEQFKKGGKVKLPKGWHV